MSQRGKFPGQLTPMPDPYSSVPNGDDEELTDCPKCGVNGYTHKPDCRVPRYIRGYNEAFGSTTGVPDGTS